MSGAFSWSTPIFAPPTDLLGHVPMDNVSLSKILCHRNCGNEFLFTHSNDYLYYLARSPLSQIFDNETSPQNWVYTGIFFCDKPTLSKKNCPWELGLNE